MARSQEALLKRALKRDVPVEEQRLKDKKRKSINEEVTGNQQTQPSLQPNQEKHEVDKIWICLKCRNKNFVTREECNRCGDTFSQSVSVKTSVSSNTAVSDISKPSSQSLLLQKNVPPKTKPVVVSQIIVKHKKYDWGEQATVVKLEENKSLLSAFTSGKDNVAYQQLNEVEIERAKILLARKARKEVKKAKAVVVKKFLSLKKSQKSAKIAASASVAVAALSVSTDSSSKTDRIMSTNENTPN